MLVPLSQASPFVTPTPSTPFRGVPAASLPILCDRIQSYGRPRAADISPTMLAFANYRIHPTAPDLVLPSLHNDSHPSVRTVLRTSQHEPLFRKSSCLSTAIRYGRFVACFNLYPGTARDLAVNDLLWQSAHNGEYDPQIGNALLQYNVLALAFPSPFYSFLSSVSKQHLDRCILELLTLIADGEDPDGLNLMKQELEPTVWTRLITHIQRKQATTQSRGESHQSHGIDDDKVMADVEMLLRFCHLSPWKIEVYASFVTPRDMALITARFASEADTRGESSLSQSVILRSEATSDRVLVRSSARRPIWITGGIGAVRMTSGAIMSNRHQGRMSSSVEKLSNKKLAFWTQFLHWRVYRRVLVQGCGVHPVLVSDALLSAIANGSVDDSLQRALTVMCCACVQGNLLSSIPKDVVFRYIAPYVLLAG